MVNITKATKTKSLPREWQDFTKLQYGKNATWVEKVFRFKATEGDTILGTIEGKYESGIVYIAALMVTEQSRGKGIGNLLIQHTEKWAKKQGAHRTWLSTGKQWVNRGFYEKLGFAVLAELPDFYFHQDFVIYTRLIR